MSLEVVFRADASSAIGTGHVSRCLTLADVLASQGANCRFVCRQAPGNLIDRIQRRGFDVGCLPAAEESHATDADQTLAALGGGVVDSLVVDHYALDARWEKRLRGACRTLCVIDDLADRPHDCDLLLDQNWFAHATLRRYDALVPERCIKLLGPKFALLAPEYATLRGLMPPRDGLVRRVMVSLGGGDPTNETAKVLEALMQPDLAPLAVDVVLGANHPCPDEIATLVERRPGTTLHVDVDGLAGLIARADLGIGAGGVTGWERMSLGLPSVVVSIADNQTPTNEALAAANHIYFAGVAGRVDADAIARTVRQAAGSPATLRARAAAMQSLVSADGAMIVGNILSRLVSGDATAPAY